MSPDEYCQQKTVQSGSSFYYSFLFLPPERRRAITALYAFCREVDDTVDECTDQSIARIKLAWWRNEVSTMYAGTPDAPGDAGAAAAPGRLRPGGTAPAGHHRRHGDGPGPDPLPRLSRPCSSYCWHVASVVGILSASIFGVTNPQTLEYAEKLGLAFQLTNIIRDVGEDARKGRIYLPVNELQQFGVTAADLLNARHSDKFEALMRFQAERAQATVRRSVRAAAEGRPARPASGPDDGGDLPHRARRNRARQLQGADPAHFAHAAAQAVAGVEDLCPRLTSCSQRRRRRRRLGRLRGGGRAGAGRLQSHPVRSGAHPGRARARGRGRTAACSTTASTSCWAPTTKRCACCDRVGVDPARALLHLPLQMRYPPGGGGMDFVAPRLPAPLHLAVALLRAKGLARADKLALARFSTTARWMGWTPVQRLQRHRTARALRPDRRA